MKGSSAIETSSQEMQEDMSTQERVPEQAAAGRSASIRVVSDKSNPGNLDAAAKANTVIPGLEGLSTGAGRVRGRSGRIFGGKACGLRVHSWLRRHAIQLVEAPLFDPFILLVILANCTMMAWESPLDPCCTPKAELLAVCDEVILGIFTIEVAVKMLAYGLFGSPHAYLHDGWCQLDLAIVSLTWLPVLWPALGNYSAARAVRALRPLRALKRLPGMPLLVQWIFDVLPKCVNVLALCGFLLLILAIAGMEMFKGATHYRCSIEEMVADEALTMSGDDPIAISAGASAGGSAGGIAARLAAPPEADSGVPCNPANDVLGHVQCADFSGRCEYFDMALGGGLTSFDTTPLSLLALMMVTTFDDWAAIMYALSASFSPYVWIYCTLGQG